MEGFRFFEAFPVEVGWHQPRSTASLLATRNIIQHMVSKKKEDGKSCRMKKTYKNILQVRENVSRQ